MGQPELENELKEPATSLDLNSLNLLNEEEFKEEDMASKSDEE